MTKKIILFLFLLFCLNIVVVAKDIHTECELGDLVGEDVVRIKFDKFNVDYHKTDLTKRQVKKFARECIKDGIKTQFQMDCCMTKKMFSGEK